MSDRTYQNPDGESEFEVAERRIAALIDIAERLRDFGKADTYKCEAEWEQAKADLNRLLSGEVSE